MRRFLLVTTALICLPGLVLGESKSRADAKSGGKIPDRHQRQFYEGVAAVGVGTIGRCFGCTLDFWNLKWGFIDRSNKWLVKPQYTKVRDFSEGLAAVRKLPFRESFGRNFKWGYIDKTGAVVIPFRFDNAFGFTEGLARVVLDGMYGYIDRKGTVVVPFQFTEAHDFAEGFALVRFGGWTMIEDSGGWVKRYDANWAYINRDGAVAFRLESNTAPLDPLSSRFSAGRTPFTTINDDGEFCGYFDTKGRIVIAPDYEACQPFKKGLAKVLRRFHDAGWACIDTAGAVVGRVTTPSSCDSLPRK